MAKANNPVMTRFTTGKVRLTYAYLWTPRASDNDSDGDGKEEKDEKYRTCILIPKADQATVDKFKTALNYAVQLGQTKGLWGANLPTNFKFPLRDGDAEYLEKGEEFQGHWFLNASSTRQPRIVDLARNDIYDEREVYSGCYARVCINLFPFNQRGNRGVGCGLEAIQKICDGEALGGTQVDVDEAFGDSEAYLADAGNVQSTNGNMPQQAQGYPQGVQQAQQAALGNPVQQGYVQPVQGYGQAAAPTALPQQGQAGYPAPQYPVQQGGYQQPQPSMQGAANTFANNVAVANSILPPQLFGEGQQSKVA